MKPIFEPRYMAIPSSKDFKCPGGGKSQINDLKTYKLFKPNKRVYISTNSVQCVQTGLPIFLGLGTILDGPTTACMLVIGSMRGFMHE